MHVNTLESSHLQELWKHVEGINENKTPVTEARDFLKIICVLGRQMVNIQE